MTNESMIANRYGRWAKSRKLVAEIQDALRSGGMVMMATCTKYTQYDSRHVNLFKATRNGAYVQHGKRWDCIDYCGFRFCK